MDDGRRRTTDESALEKLRCLSAGGAKKKAYSEDEIHVIVDMVEADYDAISSSFTVY